VKLEAVELHRLDLAFRTPIGTAAGEHRVRPVAYVRVVTDAAEGWGECPALADGTAVDPPLAVVAAVLEGLGRQRLEAAARARGGDLPPAFVVASLFDTSPPARAAAATMEMAVLDAELRAEGRPLWERLGVDPEQATRGVPVGALVGIPGDRRIDTLVASVADAAAGGAARVRCKIEPGWDVEPISALRDAFPGLALQADANGSYRLASDGADAAERLALLDDAGLTCIEQPLPPADLPALARLATRLATPVCLDESLGSERRLADALRYGACEVACLKPGRLGGILAARRAQRTCADAGVPAFVGGFFETGLARTANAALAALPGFTLPGDLSDPEGYLVANPAPIPPQPAGRALPFSGAGVGPPPRLPEPPGRR
jgi:o-succinylbenzoate synthase